ncbi:N-formylglutamate amidohydrolase [Promineifilum sp.]|uniref:N-formylglutamate amidohydrolase n=1 Tax=Promineifilum sp. TaxID=2664178 RepID=UPI0035AF4363
MQPGEEAPALLDRLAALEAGVTYRAPPPDGQPPFRHQPGHLPLLLSAPHGAAHRRDGRYKQEDEYTSAFARLLAERTGAHALYACACSDSDPNWDRDTPYKAALRQLAAAHDLRFILDLHGMSDRHRFGLAVGTMCGASCPGRHEALIVATLTAAGFTQATAHQAREYPALRWDRFVVNHSRFTGGLTSHTVTRFAAEELGIHAAQFELCASLRIVGRADPAGIVQTVAAFETLIAQLGARG